MTKYKIIKTLKEVHTLIKYCKQTGYCANDFETNGEKYYVESSYPTILGVSFQPGSAWIIPLGHYASPFKDCYKEILTLFGTEVIQNSAIVKISHNLIHENHWWRKHGIQMRGVCHDSMLAKHLLDEERPHGLKDLVARFLPEFAGYDLPGSNSDSFKWALVDLEELSKYCGIDCDACFRLMLFFEDRLIKHDFYNLYRNLLLMQVRVLTESEEMGMLVDRDYLDGLVKDYAERIADKEEELRSHRIIKRYEKKNLKDKKEALINNIYKEIEQLKIDNPDSPAIKNREQKIQNIILGNHTNNKDAKFLEPINFGSPQQLIDLFFESPNGFKFKVVSYTQDKKTKKYTTRPSTAEAVLVELAKQDDTGFMEQLLDLRGLSVLYSTFIVGMREKLTPDNRIHGSFLIHGTVTGRLSSRDPNLQNIPRVTTNPDIKRMFIPPPGYLCVELDYSQAELRVVAELSKDKVMIEMFQKGHNIHCATAAKMARMPYEEFYPMTKDQNHPRHDWATKMKKKAKCYSPETEVLTLGGWVRLDEYQGQVLAQYDFDNNHISFTEPTHWGRTYSERNYIYEDRNISLNLTEDHKTPFITRNGVKVRKDFKDLVGCNGYVPSSSTIQGLDYKISEDNTRFLSMVAADGSIRKNGVIILGFTKGRKITRCTKLLDSLGINYSLNNRGGNSYFYLPKQDSTNWVGAYLTRDKELSWACLTDLDGKIYLDESKHWDATLDSRWSKETSRFFSVVEQTIDVMQAMGTIHGVRAVKVRDELKSGRVRYRLSYNPGGKELSRVNFKNAQLDTNPRWMYGVTVPTENLVIRHNNKVTLSGNTYNFGILYGQTADKLAETIAAATKERKDVAAAEQGLIDWFDSFPGVAKWIKRQKKKVMRDGFVVNPFGRKRRLPDIYSDKWGPKASAERDSVNAPIQGCASDFTQFSSVVIRDRNLRGQLPHKILPQFATVHDSLDNYMKPEFIHDIVPEFLNICNNPETKDYFKFQFKYVNMKVSIEVGKTWADMHEYDPKEDYTKWLTT